MNTCLSPAVRPPVLAGLRRWVSINRAAANGGAQPPAKAPGLAPPSIIDQHGQSSRQHCCHTLGQQHEMPQSLCERSMQTYIAAQIAAQQARINNRMCALSTNTVRTFRVRLVHLYTHTMTLPCRRTWFVPCGCASNVVVQANPVQGAETWDPLNASLQPRN